MNVRFAKFKNKVHQILLAFILFIILPLCTSGVYVWYKQLLWDNTGHV